MSNLKKHNRSPKSNKDFRGDFYSQKRKYPYHKTLPFRLVLKRTFELLSLKKQIPRDALGKKLSLVRNAVILQTNRNTKIGHSDMVMKKFSAVVKWSQHTQCVPLN